MQIETLHPDQYPTLIGVGTMTADKLPPPATSRIVVARRDDGTIAAYWVAQAVIHVEPIDLSGVEGLGRGKVFMEMLPALMTEVASTGDNSFFAFAADESMIQYAMRLGLTPLPYVVFQGTIPVPPAVQENS